MRTYLYLHKENTDVPQKQCRGKYAPKPTSCPFGCAGQYFDSETNLCYNRHRYCSPQTGSYLSQDPIRLADNNPTLYAYVSDPNILIYIFGLSGRGGSTYQNIQNQIFGDLSKTHGSNVKIEGQIDLENGSSRYGDVVVEDPMLNIFSHLKTNKPGKH